MLNKHVINSFEKKFLSSPLWYAEALKVYMEEECYISVDVDEYENDERFKDIKFSIKPYLYQWFDRFSPQLIEIMICAFLNQEMCYRHLGYFFHKSPLCFADKQIEENDKLVKNYINDIKWLKITEACFTGGTQGEDGYIKIENNEGKINYFPLEIGYCRASQIYAHLAIYGRVARLPYGAEYIVYFELKDIWKYRPNMLS